MTRECEKLEVKDVLGEVLPFKTEFVELYIDKENKDEILTFFKKKKKKTRRILYEIFSNRYNPDLYGKEEVSAKAKNVTAMKFKGKGNERVYCKEFFHSDIIKEKKIVMITLYSKREMDKKTKKFIENLGGYEYVFK